MITSEVSKPSLGFLQYQIPKKKMTLHQKMTPFVEKRFFFGVKLHLSAT
jgi:hypothetical protein